MRWEGLVVRRRRVLGMVARGVAGSAVVPGWMRLYAAGARVADRFAERLQLEVSRLGTRVYSEQGIPMILACEDLVAGDGAAAAPEGRDAEFAPEFARCAGAWEELHPGAAGGEVASLVELLAVRDFRGGGRRAE